MPETKEYEVIKDVELKGAQQAAGSVIDLTAEEAAEAEARGDIKIFVRPPAPVPPTPPAPEPGPEGGKTGAQQVYTLTAEQLKELIGEATKPMANKISMLEAVADTKAMENWFRKNRKEVGTIVRLSTHNGKVITSWRTVEDTVAQDINSGRWFEKQIMRVTYEDGTEVDVPYMTFTNMLRLTQVKAKVLEKTQIGTDDPDVKRFRFKVEREDNGKVYEIMDSFVN